jgi:branched-chain amino acid aminotransferase
MIIYVNGEYFPQEEAKISVLDHGFLYGDGVFEGMRSYAGKIFKCEEHIDRLFDSARAICLNPPVSKAELNRICYEALEKNDLKNAYLRVIFSRGVGDLGLNPKLCEKAGLVVIAGKIKLYPEELYQNGMEVMTGATPRIAPEALNPKIKSLNYLNNILAKLEGMEHGMMETLMLNSQGYLAEATGDNIFIVSKGIIYTPPEEAGILLGITRQTVIDLARESGIEVVEKNLNRYDLFVADECFLTGSAAEIISVTKVDGRVIGNGLPGPITVELLKTFRELTHK